MNNPASKKFIFISALLLVSLYVFLVFLKNPGINAYERSKFPDMIDGKAWKPFVYRVFVPVSVNLFSGVVPQGIKNSITEFGKANSSAARVLSELNWEPEYLTEYLIASLLMYLSLVGFALMLIEFFKLNFKVSESFVKLLILGTLLALPVFYINDNYIYDFPSLFFFTTGLFFLQKQNWKLFLFVFFFSCWNKETTILLTLIFLIHYRRNFISEKRKFYALLAAQLILFLITKVILSFTFSDNPGSFVEFHLLDYNKILLNGYNLITFSALLFLVLLVSHNWKEKPQFLKNSLWIAIPLFLLTLILGFFNELRDYYEIYPIIVLLIGSTVAKIIGLDISINKKIVAQKDDIG
jgi:hypothetical protein